MSTENIGDISNLISKSAPKPEKAPSRIEVLEGRVATLEASLKTVISELTALRAEVKGLRLPKAKASPQREAKLPSAVPRKPSPKAKSKHSHPWDTPEILQELEACRPKILDLLSDGNETTKQGCADALGIDASLVGRTFSYLMTVKKEIEMISPPKTADDPDPKKLFRRKQK